MRIVVAIDGSHDARAAVGWLGRLPLPADHHVTLVTVVVPPIAFIDVDKAQQVRSALTAEAQGLVDGTVLELRRGGRFVGGQVIVADDARQAIIAKAREWDAHLIATGARGLGAAARFFLGSVALRVARQAPCPVLVCKGPPSELHGVTVALDGSDHARRALDWLTNTLVLSPATRLHLLGVAETQPFPSSVPVMLGPTLRVPVAAIEAERRAALETELSTAAQSLRARLPSIETVVLSGAPADVIVRDIEPGNTDLVVLGARGLGAASRLLLGSVSEAVLNHSPCSVLIVRPAES